MVLYLDNKILSMEDLFERIKKFVVEQRWDQALNRGTTLQEDLGIYGDDADDFIKAFSKEFNVDISEFRIKDYFNSEMDPVFSALLEVFNVKKSKKVITLGDLEEAVNIGKLI